MSTETVVRNSGSVAGSMTCPKCGYVQEERLDCRKCGVVFSKYYALHSPGKSAGSNGASQASVQESQEQDSRPVVTDMQLQLRELSSKISEIEFEKAERNRLQKEIKELDRRIQDNLDGLKTRLDQHEKRIEELSASKPVEQNPVAIPAALEERLRRVEDKIPSVDHMNHEFADLVEKYGINLQQILEIRDQVSGLTHELEEFKTQMGLLQKAQESAQPKIPVEEEVRAVLCKHLDSFRQSLGDSGEKQ